MKVRIYCLFFISFFVLAACVSSSNKEAKNTIRRDDQLFIAAAASLESVLESQVIPAFEQEYPEIKVQGNYDSSGKLQAQIEKGLEADLFFSAAMKQMDNLASQKFINQKNITPLLKNQLVLIVPKTSTIKQLDFSELEELETIAIGDPTSVPAGQYAEEGLTALGYWDAIKDHASFGTNVTEVLNWVAKGSAPAGLVYRTDAATSDRVRVVATLPEETLKESILYPVAIIEKSKRKTAAKKFLQFLQTKQSKNYFEAAGFTINK